MRNDDIRCCRPRIKYVYVRNDDIRCCRQNKVCVCEVVMFQASTLIDHQLKINFNQLSVLTMTIAINRPYLNFHCFCWFYIYDLLFWITQFFSWLYQVNLNTSWTKIFSVVHAFQPETSVLIDLYPLRFREPIWLLLSANKVGQMYTYRFLQVIQMVN